MPDIEYESRTEKLVRYIRIALSSASLRLGLLDIIVCEVYKQYVLDGHYRLGRWIFRRCPQDVLHREVQAYLKEATP